MFYLIFLLCLLFFIKFFFKSMLLINPIPHLAPFYHLFVCLYVLCTTKKIPLVELIQVLYICIELCACTLPVLLTNLQRKVSN